jgi:hypothetical protein
VTESGEDVSMRMQLEAFYKYRGIAEWLISTYLGELEVVIRTVVGEPGSGLHSKLTVDVGASSLSPDSHSWRVFAISSLVMGVYGSLSKSELSLKNRSLDGADKDKMWSGKE